MCNVYELCFVHYVIVIITLTYSIKSINKPVNYITLALNYHNDCVWFECRLQKYTEEL